MNFAKFLLLTLAVLITPAVTATHYHVATNGGNTNEGSAAQPYRTIAYAAALARPGDTITVHEGTYRERVDPPTGGTDGLHRIVFRAAPGERVVIKGSEVITGWTVHDGTVWRAAVANTLFKDYNPYVDILTGDWLNKKGFNHHTGEVYLNGNSLFEQSNLDDVLASLPYADARDQEASTYTWYSEVTGDSTIFYANFQASDPNQELIEINVRESCFYPSRPGINYLTVSGFVMDQAATQWAAPTAEQIGLIGTHWSKGWIIENNTVSNSKSTGITLGKDRSTGHNVWLHNRAKGGATHYNEVIFRALAIGWSKETIGSHVVRNNVVFDCGQAGIVGSLGAVYSQITHNHIYDIWAKRTFTGAEMAGIKIHAAIDVLIENNRIHNTGRGIWIDWMAQGTRLTRNVLYDNTTDDLFSEVNHGPYLVDHNLFLSELSFRDWSQGGAFAHNIFAGKLEFRKGTGRFTPYHAPHSTQVAGFSDIKGGDNRYFNNIFAKPAGGEESEVENITQAYGLAAYGIAGEPNIASGNIYYGGATPGKEDVAHVAAPDFQPTFEIEKRGDKLYVNVLLDGDARSVNTKPVTTARLGSTLMSAATFEQPDGAAYNLNTDFGGATRSEAPRVGPFGRVAGPGPYRVW
ncbi:right-handed parallel beta-helix repeat-containing protein [Neolewinella antarctica]|uniref:Right handed beta helix domain-containing protein n=1 Tax=Neolewinella antarctica TaxID=442734 RepID=A0ABX0XFT6_9BACT|nr:right-handed parallel beta-helix repeat-containing protein [Neolewinella antarctica]NJC27995.1 hypothetical protein [Neolewinella antarctica]